MPITSYAPELLQVFQKASLEAITIPLKNTKRAVHLRFRLNKLRKELRKAAHPLCIAANGVQFSITPEGDLIARPADLDFLQALKAVGIGVPTVAGSEQILSTPTEPQMSAIMQFLKEGEG